MTDVRVALVQAESPGTLVGGLQRLADLTREAAEQGARLVVLPETWLPGYPAWLDCCRDAALWDHPPVKAVFRRLVDESVLVEGPSGREIGRIAAECGVTLVVGVSERVDAGPGRGTLYNSLLTFGPDGRLLNHHRKLMPTYSERMVWGQGDGAGLGAVDAPVGRVGGLICWEHWMPLARQAMHQSGEDIHVALWPAVKEMNLVASRHYAFEGRCYVLAAGGLLRAASLPPELEPHPDKVAGPDSWILAGGSAVFAPDGALLAGPMDDEAGILIADLDLDRVREEAMTLDVAGHYARPDVLRLDRAPDERRRSSAGEPP